VIDTIGNRIEEVILPIPKSEVLRKSISDAISALISSRVAAREKISELTRTIVPE
jgi:type I restriction enzyme M protein